MKRVPEAGHFSIEGYSKGVPFCGKNCVEKCKGLDFLV